MTTSTVRRLLAAAGALVVALPGAGCGSDAPGTDIGTSRPTVATTAATTPTPPTAPTTVATPDSTANTVDTTAARASTSTEPGDEPIAGAGMTFGQGDDGAVILLRVGESARLLLPAGAVCQPATGGAVELIEFTFIDAAGQSEFEVRAVAAGQSEVSCADPELQLTFVVKT